jgi:hypothetical protein
VTLDIRSGGSYLTRVDRETVIKLSNSIERLRAQVRDAEETLEKRRAQLREAEQQLDKVLGTQGSQKTTHAMSPTIAGVLDFFKAGSIKASADEQVSLPITVPNLIWSWAADNEKPVATKLRDFFAAHPRHSFATHDLMELCSIPKEQHGAVRQALKRMFDEGFLLRERGGVYALNPTRRR